MDNDEAEEDADVGMRAGDRQAQSIVSRVMMRQVGVGCWGVGRGSRGHHEVSGHGQDRLKRESRVKGRQAQ